MSFLEVVLGIQTLVSKGKELFYRVKIRPSVIHPQGTFQTYITGLLTLTKVIDFEVLMLSKSTSSVGRSRETSSEKKYRCLKLNSRVQTWTPQVRNRHSLDISGLNRNPFPRAYHEKYLRAEIIW